MKQIYLDYNATTPVAAEVLAAMEPYLRDHYGNPSSTHGMGRAAHAAIESARTQVATLLGTESAQILFTSGGTESNNLAIKGSMMRGFPAAKGHLVISAIEHPATVEPARFLEQLGFAVSIVDSNSDGVIEPSNVAAALRDDTRLVSIMHANNEIGTVQPIAEIAQVCHARGVLVHTDAAQSVGKVATIVDQLGVDLLSIAGHKVYAPKGVGALYVRPGVELDPVLHGAGHERGLRPGTENTPYIVALGCTSAIAHRSGPELQNRMFSRSEQLFQKLQTGIGEGLTRNGESADRLPNTLSVNFPRVVGARLLDEIPELCASTGSACHSGKSQMSATLQSIGLSPEMARGTVRLSTGWHTTKEEVDRAADALVTAWERLAQ